MLDKFVRAFNWVGQSVFILCLAYGVTGICLGLGAFGYGVFHDIMIFGLGG